MDQHKPELQALHESASKNRKLYLYDRPEPALLEVFENPRFTIEHDYTAARVGEKLPDDLAIHIEVPEFTSLCPITGQPDFANIIIDYRPNTKCVESKSLKLYLLGYRQFGEFHEACVVRIGRDLVARLDPHEIRVYGDFAPRGGIPFKPTYYYKRPE